MIKFHDDEEKAFKPLADYTDNDEEFMADYMYMYHEEKLMESRYFYKHKETRDYLQLTTKRRWYR